MKLTKGIAIATVSAGLFGGAIASIQGTRASAKTSSAKVLQYKTIKNANYKAVKGAKGYLFSTAKLTKKVHNVKNYSNTKFRVSKEAVVRKTNGNKAVYYYVKSTKASGWLWHGYLTRVATKKATNSQTTALQQQITSLQQQLSDLKSQISSSTNATPTATSTDNSALQSQIASLQSQLNALKNSGVTSNNTQNNSSSNLSANENPAKESLISYYALADSFEQESYVYSKPDQNSAVIGTVGGMNGERTFEVYGKPGQFNQYTAIKYNDTIGYVDSGVISDVKTDGDNYVLKGLEWYAGEGNIAPTDSQVKFTKPLLDNARWVQYTPTGIINWSYSTTTKSWSNYN